ncbi:TRAP transporter small permease [Blastococcus sp. SYSU DS0973]
MRVLHVLGWPGRIAVLALMLHVTLDTVLRKTTGEPITGTLEYVQFWYMPAICLLGFVAAELQNDHITAPVVYDRMSPAVRRELSLVAAVATVAILLAYAWWGFEEALLQLERGATGPISGIVIWPAVFLVPIGSVAAAVAVGLTLMRKPWAQDPQAALDDFDDDPISPDPGHHATARAGGR